MPVEIRELVIRAVTTLKDENSEKAAPEPCASDDLEAIIQECVRQVLRILKRTEER